MIESEKNLIAPEKSGLHPRNKHRGRYDFNLLTSTYPTLRSFVTKNQYGDLSIDYFNPDAVKALNKALLLHYYKLTYWDIPSGYLCPPVPGRADYIHHVADLIYETVDSETIENRFSKQANVKCLDIGVGANCIYPIIGCAEYGWSFTGSDIDPAALESAGKIVERNSILRGKVELRLQENKFHFFKGVIDQNEFYDLTICNPPFHSSPAEVNNASTRKLSNLTQQRVTTPRHNFGGQNNELWYSGGEAAFVMGLIRHSRKFSDNCNWFTTLVSKQSNLNKVYKTLAMVHARTVKTIPMQHGNKMSRVIAWTFRT